jgi:hypothetical protein
MKQENQNVIELELSSVQVEKLDNVTSAIESVLDMDNIYNTDRAKLVDFVVVKVAELLGVEPSFKLWGLVHDYIQTAICKARGMSDESFNNNIWSMITKRLELDFALVKPESANPESIARNAQRKAKQEKIDALTDKQLKEQGMLVELAKREEKRLENANKLIEKAKKDFGTKFTASMKELAKNEYDFAMYIDKNLNAIRKDFEAQK